MPAVLFPVSSLLLFKCVPELRLQLLPGPGQLVRVDLLEYFLLGSGRTVQDVHEQLPELRWDSVQLHFLRGEPIPIVQ